MKLFFRNAAIPVNRSITFRSCRSLTHISTFFDKIFKNEYPFEDIYPYPKKLTGSIALYDQVERFLSTNNDPLLNDKNRTIDAKVLAGLKDLGLYGLFIPKSNMGLGLTHTQAAHVMQALHSDPSLLINMLIHNYFCAQSILLHGGRELKEKYLPKLATGQLVGAMAMAENDSGSDIAAIKTVSHLSTNGLHYTISGSKKYVTNGDQASLFLVFSKVSVDSIDRFACFVIDKETEGVNIGASMKKNCLNGTNLTDIEFTDVKIPEINLLSDNSSGDKIVELNISQSFPALCLALSKIQSTIITKIIEHGKTSDHYYSSYQKFSPELEFRIANMLADNYAIQTCGFSITRNLDEGKLMITESLLLKNFTTDILWNSIDECIQLIGEEAYYKDEYLQLLFKDIRPFKMFMFTDDLINQFALQKAIHMLVNKSLKTILIRFNQMHMDATNKEYTNLMTLLSDQLTSLTSTLMVTLKKYNNYIFVMHENVKHVTQAYGYLYVAATVLSRIITPGCITSPDEEKLALHSYHRLIKKAELAKRKFLVIDTTTYGTNYILTNDIVANNGSITRPPFFNWLIEN